MASTSDHGAESSSDLSSARPTLSSDSLGDTPPAGQPRRSPRAPSLAAGAAAATTDASEGTDRDECGPTAGATGVLLDTDRSQGGVSILADGHRRTWMAQRPAAAHPDWRATYAQAAAPEHALWGASASAWCARWGPHKKQGSGAPQRQVVGPSRRRASETADRHINRGRSASLQKR